MTNTPVAAVILAAGGSTRYGQPKQLLSWKRRPLIAHIADVAWMAGLDPVIVVVGAAADAITSVLASRPVRVVRNYRWAEGMSSSLSVGIAALPAETEASLFLPVDQPLLTPRLLQQFVDAWRQERPGILIPRTAEGERGTPVLFERSYFAELAMLTGDIGGRALFGRYATEIAQLPVSDSRVLTDIDTPEIYQRLKAEFGAETATSDPRLSSVRGLICDMDGVLWRGATSLPGIQDFFTLIRELDLAYVLVTNNSSRTPEQYVHKLDEMGVETSADHILNSAVATARYVAEQKPGASVYAIGAQGVRHALASCGLVCYDAETTQKADFVVVGWDRQLTWQKLATATRLILEGATFVSTNPDRTFPLETSLAPGNGAQTAALQAATGIEPTIVGKPAAPLYRQALERMGTTPETTLVIGDRLDTDILGGVRLGMPTALVLTGISQPEDLQKTPIHPTAVFAGLPDLVKMWSDARRSQHP